MSWERRKIQEICTLVTSGGTPKTSIPSYYTPAVIPWLKTAEVNYCRIYDTETHISEEGLKNSSAKLIPENSIIIAMYGQGDTAGRVAINKIPLSTNQACCNLIINHDIADYEFVYYALSIMYEKMVSLKNGGAQPNLNAGIIKALEIPFPDIEVQHKIAKLLSTYDDLIETNQRQIHLLEEMAQRLYKEWFVDLRFPGYEGVQVTDGVPEGWELTTVEELSEVLRRGISPKYNDEAKFWVINQKCIRQTVMDMHEARRQEKAYPPELNLQDSDTVICSTGTGTLGRVGQVFGEYPNTTLDSHVTVVRAKETVGKQFLFQTLKYNQPYLMSMGKGSTNQQELGREVMKAVKVTVPTDTIMAVFEKIAQPTHDQITTLQKLIIDLTEARDKLLPKLMSGEIEVP